MSVCVAPLNLYIPSTIDFLGPFQPSLMAGGLVHIGMYFRSRAVYVHLEYSEEDDANLSSLVFSLFSLSLFTRFWYKQKKKIKRTFTTATSVNPLPPDMHWWPEAVSELIRISSIGIGWLKGRTSLYQMHTHIKKIQGWQNQLLCMYKIALSVKA